MYAGDWCRNLRGVKKKTKEQRQSKTLNCQKFEDLCHKDQVSYYGIFYFLTIEYLIVIVCFIPPFFNELMVLLDLVDAF